MADDLLALHRQAQRHLNRGQWPALVRSCSEILARDERFADAWFLLAIAAEAGGDLRRALELSARAVALAPANAEYLAQRARFLTRANQAGAALQTARAALAAGPGDALTLDTIGVALTRLGHYTEALEALEKAVARRADNPQFHFNLAAAAQFLGDDDKARRHYRRALALQPDFARAWWALAEVGGGDDTAADDLAAMRTLLGRPGCSAADTLYLSHAIARTLEKGGDCGGAFRQLEAGKRARRERLQYDAGADAALFDALTAAFREPDRERRETGAGPQPLFVVGMPRTGTTLVERILASHGAVQSLGELQDFAHAVKRASGSGGGAALDAEVIAGALRAPPEHIADDYLRSTAERLGAAPPGLRYVLDKMPLNVLYVGFILRALPAARVVILRRHPLDTCLANYRQLFAVDFSYYNYAYDLEDTARYFLGFQRLVAHWRNLYGPRLHELHYERLVENPRDEVAALLDYLDLPWEENCLAFHRNRAGVATPSALQVRRPLYRDAIGRWRRYGEAMTPARRLLEAAGVDCRDERPPQPADAAQKL
jgi:tetratricopeptide (TPR) repeat protein